MMKIETRANFKGRFHNLNDFYATATSYLRGVKFSFISMPVPVCQAEHIEHGVNCNKITVRVQFPLLNWVVLFLAIFSYNGFFFAKNVLIQYRHNSLITQRIRPSWFIYTSYVLAKLSSVRKVNHSFLLVKWTWSPCETTYTGAIIFIQSHHTNEPRYSNGESRKGNYNNLNVYSSCC